MGSRVVAKTQDLLWKEREGYVHIRRRKGTEGGGRFPEGVVGQRGAAIPPGWVRPEGGRKTPDGLARESHEAVKPKLYYACDGYADAYPRAPT